MIGCSEYQRGWKRLPNAVKDTREVAEVLRKLGFDVERVEDPGSQRLCDALNSLVADAGRGKDRDILVYFARHEHTKELSDEMK